MNDSAYIIIIVVVIVLFRSYLFIHDTVYIHLQCNTSGLCSLPVWVAAWIRVLYLVLAWLAGGWIKWLAASEDTHDNHKQK